MKRFNNYGQQKCFSSTYFTFFFFDTGFGSCIHTMIIVSDTLTLIIVNGISKVLMVVCIPHTIHNENQDYFDSQQF